MTGTDARQRGALFPVRARARSAAGEPLRAFPPCGIVAGVMARTDAQRGVWKAPAGIDATLSGVQGLADQR